MTSNTLTKLVSTFLLAISIFLLDYNIELGVAGGVPYIALVLTALWYKDSRISILLGVIGILLTILGFYLSPSGGELWKVLLNRFYAIGAIAIVTFFVYYQRKIEEQMKRRNFELEKANKELEEFSYVAAHDLKAPLIGVNTLLNMIKDEDIVGEASKKIFGMVKTSFTGLQSTVVSLNEIIAIKATLGEVKEQLNFEKVFEEIKEGLAYQIDANGVVINKDFLQCPEIKYSKLQLRSVMHNLLDNAIKYRDPNRPLQIEVKTELINNTIRFSMADNGLGFDSANPPEKVLGLFNRLHTHVEGQGVGLYAINSLVSSNGGKIEIESELGRGTTFKVYLKGRGE